MCRLPGNRCDEENSWRKHHDQRDSIGYMVWFFGTEWFVCVRACVCVCWRGVGEMVVGGASMSLSHSPPSWASANIQLPTSGLTYIIMIDYPSDE